MCCVTESNIYTLANAKIEGLDLVSRPLVVFGLLPHENKVANAHTHTLQQFSSSGVCTYFHRSIDVSGSFCVETVWGTGVDPSQV